MNVTRILRRAAVLCATGTVLGVGMLVAAPPAHAMSREAECNRFLERGVYWHGRALSESDATRRSVYWAAYVAAFEAYMAHDCV